VLLLDEPLGALDLKLRKEMQLELKALQREVGITFVYVTHDQEEALTMSDTIVVMRDGRIQQQGGPTELYERPVNHFVAGFIGSSNFLGGTLLGAADVFAVEGERLLVAFEVPTRQAFVMDLVGKADVMNAIALNSSAFNVSRVIGPVIAGAVIAAIGIAACFFLNALSFVAVLGTLAYMRLPAVPPTTERRNAAEAFREGFRYVSRERWPRTLVLLTATLSVFGFSFLVMLPVFARDVLSAGPEWLGALVAAEGLGSLAGCFLASLIMGLVQTYAVVLDVSFADLLARLGLKVTSATPLAEVLTMPLPRVGALLPYLMLILVLLIKPRGLMGTRDT